MASVSHRLVGKCSREQLGHVLVPKSDRVSAYGSVIMCRLLVDTYSLARLEHAWAVRLAYQSAMAWEPMCRLWVDKCSQALLGRVLAQQLDQLWLLSAALKELTNRFRRHKCE